MLEIRERTRRSPSGLSYIVCGCKSLKKVAELLSVRHMGSPFSRLNYWDIGCCKSTHTIHLSQDYRNTHTVYSIYIYIYPKISRVIQNRQSNLRWYLKRYRGVRNTSDCVLTDVVFRSADFSEDRVLRLWCVEKGLESLMSWKRSGSFHALKIDWRLKCQTHEDTTNCISTFRQLLAYFCMLSLEC